MATKSAEHPLEADPDLAGVLPNSAHAALRERSSVNDRRLVELLGQWVSGLEPTIHVADNGLIAGLGDEDTVLIWYPGMKPPPIDWRRSIFRDPVFRGLAG